MSWSVSTPKPVEKNQAEAAIDSLEPTHAVDGPTREQINNAKAAAKVVLRAVPGPYVQISLSGHANGVGWQKKYVQISLSGHANGVGWQKKEGYANDCININVTQFTEADLKYFQ